MFRKFALVALAVVSAFAGAQQKFAQHSTSIRAGILLIDSYQSGGFDLNDAPHALYNFDSNNSIKPGGWDINNPLSPSGTNKRDASYWQVFLSKLNETTVCDYDLLVLPAHGQIRLNSYERGMLQHFMEHGGTLWIDVNSNTDFSGGNHIINNFPVPFALTSAPSGATALFAEPLLSYPQLVSSLDLSLIQTQGGGVRTLTMADLGGADFVVSMAAESTRLQPVVFQGGSMSVAMARVGEGYEVVTGGGVSSVLNSVPGNFANNGSAGVTPSFDAATNGAAKLLVNIISLGADSAQQGKGSRRDNGLLLDLGAPLLEAYHDTLNAVPPSGTYLYHPPVVFKGLLVVTGADRVYVYDADPKTDLNGDGNPDDGIADYYAGSGHDLIWESEQLPGPISSPTCVTIENPATNVPAQQIWVQDHDGNAHCYDAFAWEDNVLGAPNSVQGITVTPPTESGTTADFGTGLPQAGPFAPTYHDGIVFMSDNVDTGANAAGRIWLVSAAQAALLKSNRIGGNAGWFTGGVANNVINDLTAPATVGYIPVDDSSGGLDRVVYVATRGSTALTNNPAGITSLWLGTKGERPTQINATGGALVIATRASTMGMNVFVPDTSDNDPAVLALSPRLTILHADGTPLSKTEMTSLVTPGQPSQQYGIITYGLTGTWDDTYSVRVDYTIDWGTGTPATTAQIMRGQMFLPDDQNHSRRILNNIALSPQGTLHLVISSQDDSTDETAGGSYYAVRERGRGSFYVLTRWDLADAHTVALSGTTDFQVPATIANNDPVIRLFPGLFGSGQLQHLTFMSGPTLGNGMAYVVAEGISQGGFSIPCTVLLAFKEEPDVPVLKFTNGDLSGAQIWQADVLRSTTKSAPDATYSVAIGGPDQVVGDSSVSFQNLANNTRGPLYQSLNLSEPIVIRRAGSPDLVVYPDADGSAWNPLQWYTVFTGIGSTYNSQASGPPLLSGSTVYVPGTSRLPSLISGGPFSLVNNGIVYAIKGDVSPNDPFLVPDNNQNPPKPWLQQLTQITPANASQALSITNILPNPDILWPQTVGVTNFDEWRTRILQSTMGNSSIALGLAGGDGKVFSWTDTGVFAFDRADFLIVDQDRVAEIDSAGNPIWSTDVALSTGMADNGGPGKGHALVSPSRAYKLTENQTIVVDPGSNRLAVLDRSGREVRSIDNFAVDQAFHPDGYTPGEPAVFNHPNDVAVYTEYVDTPKLSPTETTNPFSTPQTTEYWVHYVIADSGNRRLVDLVDRYAYNRANQALGNPIALGVLYWQSPSSASGGKFSYNSVARVYVTPSNTKTTPGYKIIAGIGNAPAPTPGAPTTGDFGQPSGTSGTGQGGVVIFDGPNTQIIDKLNFPNDIAAGALYQNGSGDLNGQFGAQPAVPAHSRALSNVSSVTARYVSPTELAIMVTDSSGVYEFTPDGNVRWFLPRSVVIAPGNSAPVYSVMRRTGAGVPTTSNPVDFRPTYARRMDSGDVLIANGYVGHYRKAAGGDPNKEFTGEIVLINGSINPSDNNAFGWTKTNLGFNSLSIKFSLPPVSGTRGIVVPVFADRR